MSDSNAISVRFAKYETDTVINLIENKDYSCCICLIKTTQKILDKLRIENKKFTKITYQYEYCREYVQVKWYSLFDDIIKIMCNR